MSVIIEGLSKRFDKVRVVESLNVTFREGHISVLLGASGCGKTTTLRCIAGLEDPDQGEIVIQKQTVFSSRRNINLQPERRQLGMVFQSYAIWPHMTVFENVALPLVAAKRTAAEVKRRAEETIALVGLSHLSDRSATKLSGGQQQRVAIARCLANQPKLILLDEPLSNLDAKLRVAMRQELRELQRRIGATMIFVTHDQEEAMSLADEIFLFQDGNIAQRGTPQELYSRPRTRYVAEFLGKANVLEVRIIDDCPHALVVGKDQPVTISRDSSGRLAGCAGTQLCMIRPESWQIVTDGEGIPAEVEQVTYLGGRRELHLTTPLGSIMAVVPGHVDHPVGAALSLSVTPEQVQILEPR